MKKWFLFSAVVWLMVLSKTGLAQSISYENVEFNTFALLEQQSIESNVISFDLKRYANVKTPSLKNEFLKFGFQSIIETVAYNRFGFSFENRNNVGLNSAFQSVFRQGQYKNASQVLDRQKTLYQLMSR